MGLQPDVRDYFGLTTLREFASMMRLQACLIIGLGIAAAGSWATETETSVGAIPTLDNVIERRIRARTEFLDKLAGWLAEWEQGAIPLRTVTRNVKDHCEVFYTLYLDTLTYAETGKTTESRIAQNLIRHYKSLTEDPRGPRLLARIRAEYRETFEQN